MSDLNVKEVVYDGCSRHSRRNMSGFNPYGQECAMHARAAIVEILVSMERRLNELEKKLESRQTELTDYEELPVAVIEISNKHEMTQQRLDEHIAAWQKQYGEDHYVHFRLHSDGHTTFEIYKRKPDETPPQV